MSLHICMKTRKRLFILALCRLTKHARDPGQAAQAPPTDRSILPGVFLSLLRYKKMFDILGHPLDEHGEASLIYIERTVTMEE